MAYLGRQPLVGNYQVLDALTASATATYALTKDSVAVFPQTPANCIVSLNGVIQAPTDSYTISGSNIVFASALTASDSIDFITVLGDVLNIGTPSDNTVSLAKLTATGTKDATTFLRGDNTFASAGKVLQVITAIDETSRSTTSATFTDITGLSVTITPSSTSSKIYVICNTTGHSETTSASSYYTLLRGSTNLATNALANLYSAATDLELPVTMCILDSPNTTSATTYKAQFRRSSASGAAGAQYNNTLGSITAFEIQG